MDSNIMRQFVESRRTLLNCLESFQTQMFVVWLHFDDSAHPHMAAADPREVVAEIEGAWKDADTSMLEWMAAAPKDFSYEPIRLILADGPAVKPIGRGHEPATAHEAVWRIGQLVNSVIQNLRAIDEHAPDKLPECIAWVRDELSKLPNIKGYQDALNRERARILASVAKETSADTPETPKYSCHRRVSDWIAVLKKLGDEISEDTFLRRRKGEAHPIYRVNPESNRASISIAVDDLPSDYSDEM